jgi:hypothetical protein
MRAPMTSAAPCAARMTDTGTGRSPSAIGRPANQARRSAIAGRPTWGKSSITAADTKTHSAAVDIIQAMGATHTTESLQGRRDRIDGIPNELSVFVSSRHEQDLAGPDAHD